MSSVQLTTESSEPEIQFNNGIKMIVSAYETQTSILSNEIEMLNFGNNNGTVVDKDAFKPRQ